MPSLVISYWLVQGVTHMLKINENAMLVKGHTAGVYIQRESLDKC